MKKSAAAKIAAEKEKSDKIREGYEKSNALRKRNSLMREEIIAINDISLDVIAVEEAPKKKRQVHVGPKSWKIIGEYYRHVEDASDKNMDCQCIRGR